MPTLIGSFSLWRMQESFLRALKKIKRTSGYNTTPVVLFGAQSLSKIADGDFPCLAVELGDMTPIDHQEGGYNTGVVRYSWPAFVWGFVRSDGDRQALSEAASGLLADVFAALWADETLPDGNGIGTALFVEPGDVVFDMESYAADHSGFFRVRFDLIADINRSGNP